MPRAGDIRVPLRASRIEGMFFRNGSFRDVEALDKFREDIKGEPDFAVRLAHYLFEHHVRDENGMPFEDVATVDDVRSLDTELVLEAVDGFYRRDAQ